ncbi:MAG: hypothetical protein KC729_11595 [Candidatus Eisenbacteria bacterium]|uniref:Uncharacterized protein n=1 Tax=Eiseniibacteriota bacterium TaxID=2212470 RepID=A0A956RPX7_UNCEI|nr:hypothetical protein [Candidatus Eisenbacteria bacterium]
MNNESLILDLLEWIGHEPKPYSQVMDAWRTSCPRLTIWEDALAADLVEVKERVVRVTPVGRAFLRSHRVA